MMRRRGMPLVRAAATTAVVAGTAGAVRHRQDQRYANQAAQGQAEYEQSQMAAQQARAAGSTGGLDMEQLKQLGELHSAGVLNDDEFAAAKAKLIGNA